MSCPFAGDITFYTSQVLSVHQTLHLDSDLARQLVTCPLYKTKFGNQCVLSWPLLPPLCSMRIIFSLPLSLGNVLQECRLQDLALPTCSMCLRVSMGSGWATRPVLWGVEGCIQSVCLSRQKKRQTGRTLTSGALICMSSPPQHTQLSTSFFQSSNILAATMGILSPHKAASVCPCTYIE